MLLHSFEQGGLHFRGSPIDLIGEDDVCHDRAHLGIEFLGLGIIDFTAEDICRQQIRGELDPFEIQAEELCEDMDGLSLG